jgi:4'-phosphopantetheinyl transferase
VPNHPSLAADRLPHGQAVVHAIDLNRTAPATARALLSAAERARADRFHRAGDAAHWMVCRASLRQVLGRLLGQPPDTVMLEESPAGKPLLAGAATGLHFNLSHCAGLAAIVVCRHGPVGIDVEPVARASDLLECVDAFCHPREIAALPAGGAGRAAALLEIWTAKEALLKALGTGLAFPPHELWLEGGRGRCQVPPPGLAALRVLRPGRAQVPGHCLAVAVPDEVAALMCQPATQDRQDA